MDWFLYDRDLRHERDNLILKTFPTFVGKIWKEFKTKTENSKNDLSMGE